METHLSAAPHLHRGNGPLTYRGNTRRSTFQKQRRLLGSFQFKLPCLISGTRKWKDAHWRWRRTWNMLLLVCAILSPEENPQFYWIHRNLHRKGILLVTFIHIKTGMMMKHWGVFLRDRCEAVLLGGGGCPSSLFIVRTKEEEGWELTNPHKKINKSTQNINSVEICESHRQRKWGPKSVWLASSHFSNVPK